MSSSVTPPFIVGVGGTTREGSTTEQALLAALEGTEALGARTQVFSGPFLARLPIYEPQSTARTSAELEFVDSVRRADGLLLATPGYHGGPSGLVKNALDLLEDLRDDARPYLESRAVGCIVCASGTQSAGTTLVALRCTVHALRGWPTPLGATLNTSVERFDSQGNFADPATSRLLRQIGEQVVDFAMRSISHAGPALR